MAASLRAVHEASPNSASKASASPPSGSPRRSREPAGSRGRDRDLGGLPSLRALSGLLRALAGREFAGAPALALALALARAPSSRIALSPRIRRIASIGFSGRSETVSSKLRSSSAGSSYMGCWASTEAGRAFGSSVSLRGRTTSCSPYHAPMCKITSRALAHAPIASCNLSWTRRKHAYRCEPWAAIGALHGRADPCLWPAST